MTIFDLRTGQTIIELHHATDDPVFVQHHEVGVRRRMSQRRVHSIGMEGLHRFGGNTFQPTPTPPTAELTSE